MIEITRGSSCIPQFLFFTAKSTCKYFFPPFPPLSFPILTILVSSILTIQRLPLESEHEHLWISQAWAWFGQTQIPKEGCYGAPLFDTQGFVIGFFRYVLAENEGVGIGIAAEEVVTRGY